MQTSADYRTRRRRVSRMTDEKGETWSPSGMSKVRSRTESLVADCSMHALHHILTNIDTPASYHRFTGNTNPILFYSHTLEKIDILTGDAVR